MTHPGHDSPAPNDVGPDEVGPDDVSPDGVSADEAAEPAEPDSAPAQPEAVAEPTVEEQLAERTSDLQRLSAEYANYRKRVERDRQLIAENATFKALAPIIEVLDTIDRAKEHGELEGGFKSVADLLGRAIEGQGLIRFGEPGEEFDPTVHDALTHLGADPEVTVTTIKHVAKAGYKIGDRVVRAAQVVVVDPVEDVG